MKKKKKALLGGRLFSSLNIDLIQALFLKIFRLTIYQGDNLYVQGDPFMSSDVVKINRKSNSKSKDAPDANATYYYKIPIAEKIKTIADGIINEKLDAPKIKTVVVDEKKIPVFVKEDGVCEELSNLKVDELIADYADLLGAKNPQFILTPLQLDQTVKRFKITSPRLPSPADYRFKSDEGLCWHKHSFDIEEGPTPLFDEMMNRTSNAEALQAWIWSLLEPKSDRQQYVWLTGEGGDGKSTLISMLEKIITEKKCVSLSDIPGNDKHWATAIVGMRLVTFPDFQKSDSLDRGEFKSLTSCDKTSVRDFHKKSVAYKADCKVIFGSNTLPNINDTHANLRRIILCEMRRPAYRDSSYGEKLWREIGAILFKCRGIYQKLCPTFGEIPCNQESTDVVKRWVSQADERFEDWFDKKVIVGSDYFIPAGELGTHLHSYFKGKESDIRQCRALLRKKGFESEVTTKRENRQRVYIGFKLKV